MTNLATVLESTAGAFADRVAVIAGDRRLTYTDVDRAANQVANLLISRGVERGDKVALSCPNVPEFTIIYFGILKAGATVVPLSVLLSAREVAYHLEDSDAVAYFAFEGTADLPIGQAARAGFDDVESCRDFIVIESSSSIDSLPALGRLGQLLQGQDQTFETRDVEEDDTAVILFSSGTSGRPKPAALSHNNMHTNAMSCGDLFASDPRRPDTYLCVLPLFHSFGQTVIQNAGLAFGGTLVMLPRFDPAPALQLMLREQITFFAGVPTMYWGLLVALDDTAVDAAAIAQNLRVAVAGGSALPKEVHRGFQDRLGTTILEGYGLSETSPLASMAPWGEEVRVGSIGLPIPGVQMKLITDDWSTVTEQLENDGKSPVGEIAIKGPNVMNGYYRREEATAEVMRDGWFRTGDLARKDADGYYYIVDRSKDMIIRGGFNVYPREIEEILITHPAISLVAVVGIADAALGEEIKAVVVKAKGHVEVTDQDIIEWSKTQFAKYKYPRVVEFRDELPMTATGKILKREIS